MQENLPNNYSKDELCSLCRKNFPTCGAREVSFATGSDNIAVCSGFTEKETVEDVDPLKGYPV